MKYAKLLIIPVLLACFGAGFWLGSHTVQQTTVPQGHLLGVTVLSPDGVPMQDLEVDLWSSTKQGGEPDAGVSVTNGDGLAVFRVPAGSYRIGFNLVNFPEGLDPKDVLVSVSEDTNVTLNLQKS